MFRLFVSHRGVPVLPANRDDVLEGPAASERLSHLVLLSF